jgi:outer membrane lipoprotein
MAAVVFVQKKNFGIKFFVFIASNLGKGLSGPAIQIMCNILKLICLFWVITTVSCTVISRQVRSEAEPLIPFKTLLEETEEYKGRTVILGGYILQVENLASETILKVLQAPFRVGEEPDLRDLSQGRFVVYFKGFLDPEVYARDRAITVAGTVIGSDVEKIGEEGVRYLKIKNREIYLWPEYKNLPPYPNPWPYPRYWHGYPNYPYSFWW